MNIGLVIFTEKIYDNQKGYFYIPIIWREEFQFYIGREIGIDCYNNLIIIDGIKSRSYTQCVSSKGKITIPIELRKQLSYSTFHIIIIQHEEKILLVPKVS